MQSQIKQIQTVEEFINQALKMKTLKLKKFTFQTSFQFQNKSQRLSVSAIQQRKNFQVNPQAETNWKNWKPRISAKKLMKQPKILLSLQKRKSKQNENQIRTKSVEPPPASRLGFRGQKVKNIPHNNQDSQKIFQKLKTTNSRQKISKQKKKLNPNMHFNFKYLIQKRKQMNIQNRKKDPQQIKGNNTPYFVFFNSESFVDEINKKRPSTTFRTYHKTAKK